LQFLLGTKDLQFTTEMSLTILSALVHCPVILVVLPQGYLVIDK